MRKFIQTTAIVLFALLCFTSCSQEELIKEMETSQNGEVAVITECIVDGVDVTNTRAASAAGYTTGDGLYDENDQVTVTATANEGYELVAFYDKKTPSVNLGASYGFLAEVARTFKAEFRKNAEFIAVGNGGQIFTSIIGNKTITQVGTIDWEALAVGENTLSVPSVRIYAAVGGTYDSGIATISHDGISWSIPKKVANERLLDITYGNGKFVAVSDYGAIISSSNGEVWSTPQQVGNKCWESVTYGNGKFVAVGGTVASGWISTSTDGVNWSVPKQVGAKLLAGITYGNGKFVAVGYGGITTTSTDGVNWSTSLLMPGTDASNKLISVTYGNGRYVAVSQGGFKTSSTNGIDWNLLVGNKYDVLCSITYGYGVFISVAYNSSYSSTLVSSDGISWQSPNMWRDQSGKAIKMYTNDICIINP